MEYSSGSSLRRLGLWPRSIVAMDWLVEVEMHRDQRIWRSVDLRSDVVAARRSAK